MKNIVLVCNARLSTTILVEKMKEEAQKQSIECNIISHSLSNIDEIVNDASIILLAPQIGYELDNIKNIAKCPVLIVDRNIYGMVQGDKVLELALENLVK